MHIVLDYIVITVAELLERIESFAYPGQVQAVFLNTKG
jgi:hypothetical protein